MAPSFILAAIAFGVSLMTVVVIERYAARLRLVDLPNNRSSHKDPRPRGGGAGILVGVLVALVLSSVLHVVVPHTVWLLVGAAALLGLVGMWDDMRGLSVSFRLLAQTVAAAVVVASLGVLDRLPLPPPLDVPLGVTGGVVTIIWLVGVTNFFNFMDGLDGLAGGQALITLAVLVWALWPGPGAGLGIFVFAATAAFLCRNWSPARIFLGDAGSNFLGFLLAGLPLAAGAPERSRLVFVAAISLSLFLLDPIATLVARRRRRAEIGVAHREHAFQQFVDSGDRHAAVVLCLLAGGAVLSLLAAWAYQQPAASWLVIAAALAIFGAEWQAAGRRRRRRRPASSP